MSHQALAIQEELSAGNQTPVRYIVMTHGHGDHVLGTDLFGDDVLVFGNRLIRERMQRHDPMWVREWVKTWRWENQDEVEEMAAAHISPPHVVFEGELSLFLGDTEILLFPLPGHLKESIGVFLPQSGVLITGDTLFCNHHPYMGEANFTVWLQSFDKMRKLNPERIIPGHGPVCGKEAIGRQQQYMEKMIELRTRWNPEEGEDAIPKDVLDELVASYPLHGRPEAVMRSRIVESIRIAGEPQF
jgi:glyoxylase-like metal-dependent hydrolase (beta-lactamase superfamily II)